MLLVVGWDGACFELVDRFRARGAMPVFDRLLAEGRAYRLRSTVPPVTFPAWTSFLTATSPDEHGVTDFTVPVEGRYEVRFVNATHRRLPTVFARMAAAGLRVGAYGFPATYPPEGKCVFEICGFDTPLGAGAGRDAVHPRDLGDVLRARFGRLGIEGIPQGRVEHGWHASARRRLVDDIELRTEVSRFLLDRYPLDAFAVHFMESDTVAHHFWRFDDPGSPLFEHGQEGAIEEVYRALDRALGDLLEAAGPGARVVLLSDHGSAGSSDRAIAWNRWLEKGGWLRFSGPRASRLAHGLRRRALDLVPRSLQARVFRAASGAAARLESRARYAAIDWSATRVFSDELGYFPSLRFNVRGRESHGIVTAQELPDLARRVRDELLAMRDPFDGAPVVTDVVLAKERFRGRFAHRYPDLLLRLRRPGGYAYQALPSRGGSEQAWMRRLAPHETSGSKGLATSGVHGEEGLAVLVAPDVEPTGERSTSDLWDLGATTMALVGVALPDSVRGRSLVGTDGLRAHSPLGEPGPVRDYDDAGASEVEARLRDLGYLA